MKDNGLTIEIPPEARGCAPGHETELLAEAVEVRPGQRVAELGSGIGVLALALAARHPIEVVGFELQEHLVEAARHNARINADRLRGKVCFEAMDIRRLGGSKWERRFGGVVANPPFFRAGQGRRPPRRERAVARHETEATLDDFVRAAAILLRSRGRFYTIFKPERLDELIASAAEHRCPIKVLRPIYTRRAAAAEWVIAVGVKDGRPGLKIAPPRELWREEDSSGG